MTAAKHDNSMFSAYASNFKKGTGKYIRVDSKNGLCAYKMKLINYKGTQKWMMVEWRVRYKSYKKGELSITIK